MHPGYLASGIGSPFQGGSWVELINSVRANAYAVNGGISWLTGCSTCATAGAVVPGIPDGGYQSPALDPAPWYDPDNADSWDFYGVVGVDVSGDEDSTRTATVSDALSGGGVLGPPHFGPRTLVVRALVVAGDTCSLQFGLNWLRQMAGTDMTPCGGDALTFFDCCPCLCGGSGLGGPCWPHYYGELGSDPRACDPDWWPSTYAELRAGPPSASMDWCEWVDTYAEERTGPTDVVCCLNECVAPYIRQYHNTIITEGPTILNRYEMSTGALAEIEFTVVCADPQQYSLPVHVGAAVVDEAALDFVYEPEVEMPPDPFAPARPAALALATRPRIAAPPGGWMRHTQVASLSGYGPLLTAERLSLKVRAPDRAAERVRIGVWDGDERVAGYLIPSIPARATILIDGARRLVEASTDGSVRRINGFVQDWGGGGASFPELIHGEYRITVDQGMDDVVDLIVSASAVAVGAA